MKKKLKKQTGKASKAKQNKGGKKAPRKFVPQTLAEFSKIMKIVPVAPPPPPPKPEMSDQLFFGDLPSVSKKSGKWSLPSVKAKSGGKPIKKKKSTSKPKKNSKGKARR